MAEGAVHRHILQQGYQPVARNVRSRYGEVDIVARDGDAMVFLEVKARRGTDAVLAGSASVDLRKRTRLRRMAVWYLCATGMPSDTVCRFDVAVVILDDDGRPAAVQVFQDAF
jgi:putative endonuclease